ncbi:NirA family protein [Salinisphaera sp.]|uniref:NirA family protein n=1 Tax=Salinisphaera sp. TaxID=1914330 RepID=UPI002D76BA63|nr:NirA family protein [Salinisphaera sp.]HET7312762.1 NirA family protein [Salinisphaera sp.]
MSNDFTDEQQRYLQGVTAGLHIARGVPGMTGLGAGKRLAPDDWHAQARIRAQAAGGELSALEQAKAERNPNDIWDDMAARAARGEYPTGDDVFLMKAFGLFYVAPAQDGYMCRLRLPGGIFSSHQFRGVADLAQSYGGGYAHVTTRCNLQIREIGAGDPLKVLMGLYDLGIINRGAGADNVRNITGSPLAGIDPQELIDTTDLARAMHHHILHHREFNGLPRKFNIAFDSGGRVSALEGTNDVGFVAVMPKNDGPLPRRPYFRLLLGGITGHRDFARDTGVMLEADECVAVASAVLKVFLANGDRTSRDTARLKYLLDRWGFEPFMAEVQKHLPFTLRRYPLARCEARAPVQKAGHVGVHDQAQRGRRYVGVVLPVGKLSADQMRGLADLADRYGDGKLRTTVWQNVILGGIAKAEVKTLQQEIEALGLHIRASHLRAGLVACTGSFGCKFANADTKHHALQAVAHLEEKLQLEQPINIHFTGCHHSCAQHYIGDIGLLGCRVDDPDAADDDADPVDGFHVFIGGGYGANESIARTLRESVPASQLPGYLQQLLTAFKAHRANKDETFVAFVRRHAVADLRAMLDADPAKAA